MPVKQSLKKLYTNSIWHLPDEFRQSFDRVILITKMWLRQSYTYVQCKSGPVFYRSPLTNVYHCCIQRTASTWFKIFLSDALVYQYSGLMPYDAGLSGVRMNTYYPRKYARPFPPKTIVTGLYIDAKNFENLPKRPEYKAFFMIRDPRDIVVSGYFSLLYSHNPMGDVLPIRLKLRELQQDEGLIYVINYYNKIGLFDALRSWIKYHNDDSVLVVKYDDFASIRHKDVVQMVLTHCDIRIPSRQLDTLLEKYAFKKMRSGSSEEEDKFSHYRKGKPGDWQRYFDNKVRRAFLDLTGSLVEHLGYSW